MKILTEKQAESTPILTNQYESPNINLYKMIVRLKVGQALVFKKEEWIGKSHPRITIPSYSHPSKSKGLKRSKVAQKLFGRKFSIRTLADKSGYIVIRKS